MEALVVLVVLALLVLPLILASVALARSRRVEGELTALRESIDSIRERLYELRKEARVQPPPVPIAPEPPVAPAVPVSLPPEMGPQPEPPIRPPEPVPPPAPPLAPAGPPPVPLERPVPLASLAEPERVLRAARVAIDWEGFVGVKLFSWIAGVFLVIGAVFFLRYSIERGWLGAPVRMALGLIVGAGLLAVCEWKAARRYAVTANALDGAGIAILFSTVFASSALWHLLGVLPAFLLMALVTAVAVALSLRRDSLLIALLGLIGGFATPALLSTGEDRPFGLFGYLLLLNTGLAWVAYRKRWRYLLPLSLLFTTAYQWGWVAKFLTEAKLGLAAGIFLVFPLVGVLALLRLPGKGDEPLDPLFGRTVAAGALLPLLFGLYVASVPGYAAHWALLFGFQFLVVAGLAALAALRGPEELHVLGAGATLAVFAVWLVLSPRRAPLEGLLVALALFVLFFLFAASGASRLGRPFRTSGTSAVFAGPLLLFVIPLFLALEPVTGAAWLLFGVLLGLATAIAFAAALQRKPSLYLAAAPFILGAQAVWVAERLRPGNLLSGLAILATFGLFFVAVPALVPRLAEDDRTRGLVLSLAVSGPVLLAGVAPRPALSIPPWEILGVLAFLTAAASVLALRMGERMILVGALSAAQGVLFLLEFGAKAAPWPQVATAASVAVALWGAALLPLSRRREFAVPALVGLFASQLVAVLASLLSGSPPFPFLLLTHLVLVSAILWIAGATEQHVAAVLAAASCAVAEFAFQAGPGHAGRFREELLFGGALFALFLAYPLLLGRRAGRAKEPYLAAVLSSVALFFLARKIFIEAGWNDVIGLLPMCEAFLLAILLLRMLRLGIPPAEDAPRLALVAGAILAFVTVAIPLQLEKEWITIGWALLAAALSWLYRRIEHPGLLVAAAVLFGTVFARLALNRAVLSYHPRTPTPIWNWYLYTYLVPAAAFFLAARFLARVDASSPSSARPLMQGLRRLLPAGGAILLFLLLNIEIADYFSTGVTPTFRFLSATLAEGLSYTLGWAVFALALLVAGIVAASRSSRVAAVLLLLITVFKCFLFDLAHLAGLHRVASFVGLAASLAMVALLLQRFVLSGRKEAA